jgi:hypothetical protein
MNSKIFAQEQIARAVDLGLGATSPSEIEVIPVDEGSQNYRDRVVGMLRQG